MLVYYFACPRATFSMLMLLLEEGNEKKTANH